MPITMETMRDVLAEARAHRQALEEIKAFSLNAEFSPADPAEVLAKIASWPIPDFYHCQEQELRLRMLWKSNMRKRKQKERARHEDHA